MPKTSSSSLVTGLESLDIEWLAAASCREARKLLRSLLIFWLSAPSRGLLACASTPVKDHNGLARPLFSVSGTGTALRTTFSTSQRASWIRWIYQPGVTVNVILRVVTLIERVNKAAQLWEVERELPSNESMIMSEAIGREDEALGLESTGLAKASPEMRSVSSPSTKWPVSRSIKPVDGRSEFSEKLMVPNTSEEADPLSLSTRKDTCVRSEVGSNLSSVNPPPSEMICAIVWSSSPLMVATLPPCDTRAPNVPGIRRTLCSNDSLTRDSSVELITPSPSMSAGQSSSFWPIHSFTWTRSSRFTTPSTVGIPGL